MDINFIKKNKFTVIAIVIFIILFICLVQLKNLFFATSNEMKYGNRLKDVIEFKTEDRDNTINKLKENKSVKDVSIDIKGAIINVLITINDDVAVNKAKEIGNSVLPLLSDEYKKVYDVSVYLIKEDKAQNNFPIIGYKNKNNQAISYTKDREITKEQTGE